MSRALCRALALASLCSACVYQGKARPTDTPLTKAVRFLELDARGRSFDLSGTGVAAGELAEASAPAHRIPDPALVDLDSTIQVRIDRGLLQPVESGVLSEPRSRELLERKKRLMGTLDQIARVLEQRTLATAAFTELLRARRDHREALAVLAGPRRLHRGVEREQVGLPRDLLDDADLLGDLLHRRHGLADRLAAGARIVRGLGRDLVGLLRVVGVLLDAGGHLLHGRRALLGRGRLLGGALGQLSASSSAR